jgi:hypothetical protein
MTSREKAMEWWNGLTEDERLSRLRNTNSVLLNDERFPGSLTGREIELIYKKFIDP